MLHKELLAFSAKRKITNSKKMVIIVIKNIFSLKILKRNMLCTSVFSEFILIEVLILVDRRINCQLRVLKKNVRFVRLLGEKVGFHLEHESYSVSDM